MRTARPSDGYTALAEAVIKASITDIKTKSTNCYRRKDKYIACLFFTNEDCKDLWTGLAPHMIREFEHYEKIAWELLSTEFADYDPKVLKRKERGI